MHVNSHCCVLYNLVIGRKCTIYNRLHVSYHSLDSVSNITMDFDLKKEQEEEKFVCHLLFGNTYNGKRIFYPDRKRHWRMVVS